MKEYKYKYDIGPIKFKRASFNRQASAYYTESDGIPKKLINHGNTAIKGEIQIVDHYENFYIVGYRDSSNMLVSLGFKEEDLWPTEGTLMMSGRIDNYSII